MRSSISTADADGFPTVTPAAAPATAPLDPATLTVGTNVVIVAARTGAVITDVLDGFDDGTTSLTVRPRRSWTVGEVYWMAVRGYAHGVRAAGGAEVVGSPTQHLLKQESPLTCGAPDSEHADPHCPAIALLGQTPGINAAESAFQLEAIRLGYAAGGGWDLMAAAGLPRSEIAVLWGFPIHSSSVAELDPSVGLTPVAAAPDEIRIAVQGSVDPATLTPFVFGAQFGSIVVMGCRAQVNVLEGFPTVDTTYAAGSIVIKGRARSWSGTITASS